MPVLSMLVLLLLMVCKVLKPKQLQESAGFFLDHMAMFFIPVCVSVLKYVDVLLANFWAVVLISLLTAPLVFFVTGHVVQLTMKMMRRKKGEKMQ